MLPFDQSRSDALELLADTRARLLQGGWAAEADSVRDARDQMLDGRLTTVIVGEFKRGKSSLLGALIEDPDLFPTNVDIATNLVSSVEYAREEQITAFVAKDGQTVAVPISREEIPDYTTEQGNRGNERKAQLVRIQTPSPRLKTGLVLLDTPGAGGLNSEHTAVTYAVLGSADVAIFVLDALNPLTVEELSMLKTVAAQAARLLVVITKIDMLADYGPAVENAQVKLAGVLGADKAGRTPVIAVSSAAKLDWLRTGDLESLEVSRFAQLETTLWNLLAEHGGAILVSRALGRTVRILDDLIGPLDAELLAHTAGEAEIQEAAGTLRRQQERLGSLALPSAGWRTMLASAFNEIRAAQEAQLARELTRTGDELERQLTATDAINRAQALLGSLERDVTLTWSGLIRRVRLGIAELVDHVERTTGLRLNPALPEGGELSAFDSAALQRSSGRPDQESGYAALSWLGEILAYAFGDISFYVIGQLARFFGDRSVNAKKRRQEFADNARGELKRAGHELQVRLGQLLDAAENSVTTSFNTVLDADRDRLAATRQAMIVEPVAEDRVQEIRHTLAELTELRSRAVAIVGQVTGADEPVPAR